MTRAISLRPELRRLRRLGSLVFTFAALALAGAAPLSGQEQGRLAVTIDSLIVRGNQRISDTEVIDRSGLRAGQQVTYPQVQEAIKRLFSSGDFSDVEIYVSPGQGRGTFVIEVEERPTISRYEFQGLENVSPDMVRDTVGLARNAPLDPNRVARARSLVERVLANEGFPQARVDTLIRSEPADPAAYRVTFRVDEGPRLGITEVAFEGNEAFDGDRLETAMQTGEEGFFWWNPGQLQRDEFRRDLVERLPRFYAAHGYLDFEVVDDTVIVDRETGKGRVRVEVEEGPQYVLEDFRISGNRRFPTARLEELVRAGQIQSVEGDTARPFDLPAFEDATARLNDLYRNNGYLRAQVVPDLERLEAAGEGGRPRIVASWDIQEGDPTYIREIRIVGNTYTHDRVIRQQLFVFPGDVYSQDRLIRSIQAIQSLGFFEQLPPGESVELNERPDGDIDLTLRVEEQETGTLNFGVSASAATGFAGFIGYEQPNLFGQAKNGRFRWLFGGRQQDLELTYSDPAVFGSQQSASITLRNSRDQYFNTALGDRRQTGGAVEVGTPFLGLRSTRLFVGYSLFRDELRGLGTTVEDLRARGLVLDGTRSTGSARLVRDTRNSQLFPTDGSRHMLSARLTGGPLGGLGEYGKIEMESAWYVPVARIGGGLESNPIEFTLSLGFNGGVIVGDNPFFRERFYVGGVQVGQQLRGYEEATVTPAGHVPRDARGFNSLDRVGESYFTTTSSFGVKLTNSIFANAFLDAGNVWADAEDLNPTDLLVGAGVGVSLVTPFGPLGIDYAYGFDRRDVLGRPDPGWELHFKFGRIF